MVQLTNPLALYYHYFYAFVKVSHTTLCLLMFIAFLLVLVALYIILDILEIIGPKKVPGIFSIPHLPVLGNVFELANNPAKVCMEWAEKYHQLIFQIRLGNKRVVVVNSFEDVTNIWKKSSLNSRPTQYTFHNVLSSTKGFTVGTTPFSTTYKKRKQVISQALNNKSINELVEVLDKETRYTIRKIYKENPKLNYQPSSNPFYVFEDANLLRNFQYFTLRVSTYITYGHLVDCYGTDQHLADKIIETENTIIKLRSPITNYADFFPFLRFFKSTTAQVAQKTRDSYMETLMHQHSSDNNNLIHDYYEVANYKNINNDELQSICLTMLSAGLDNTLLNLNHLLGILSIYPHFQDIVVQELFKLYSNGICIWKKVAVEMDCKFAVALIKETLRHFTVLPLSLPRVNTVDIQYNGVVIPANTVLFMNAYASNHDLKIFENPLSFDPFRWFEGSDHTRELLSDSLINHFAFGKGVRMCSGNILAFKEMYILVTRLLLCFKIKSPRDKRYVMELDPFKNNRNPQATSFDPKLFKYQIQPRLFQGSDDLYNYVVGNGE